MSYSTRKMSLCNSCWYCGSTHGLLSFSVEFDTYAHRDCVEKAVSNDPEDREARIMLEEFRAVYGEE